MPRTSSYCSTCAYSIIFDTYKGCAHGCTYCFSNFRKNYDRHVKNFESAASLKSFILGKRTGREAWAGWNIPISWGRNSDPFIPRDRIFKRSLEALKVFAETKYPFIVTTKSVLPTEEPYFSLLKQCNCVFQYSIACEEMDRMEVCAPGFERRLAAMAKIAPHVKCMTARVAPLFIEHAESIKKNLERFRDAGASVVMLSLAYNKGRSGAFVEELRKGIYTYRKRDALPVLRELKAVAESLGMKAVITNFHEENSHPNCCGIDHIPGFEGNMCTLAARDHFGGKFFSARDCQRVKGTATAFRNEFKRIDESAMKEMSFEEFMDCIR